MTGQNYARFHEHIHTQHTMLLINANNLGHMSRSATLTERDRDLFTTKVWQQTHRSSMIPLHDCLHANESPHLAVKKIAIKRSRESEEKERLARQTREP